MPTSSGIKAGKAFVIIEALDKTGKVLNSIRNRIARFGSEMSAMGQTMALRAAAALTPAVLSSKAFADFDDIMKIIQSRSQGTSKEMDNIRKQALDLGEATAFTSRQIGELQAKLAQKGFKRNEILNMTEPIMNLARAGGGGLDLGIDAEQSATLVSGILNAFQMESTEATRVANLLTATVNSSNFSLEELVVTMQYAAPAAHEFGQTLEDTLAVVAAMRDLNIDASISGTAFRNMLLYAGQSLEREKFNERLSAATGKMIEFTDKAGNMRPVIHILTAIAEATKNMGNVEKADMIAGLFETRASIPATAVGKSQKTLAEMLESFKNVNDLAKKTADTMESGPGGAFRMFTSKVERLAIAIGDALAPAWVSLANSIGVTVSQITAWVDANKGLVTGVAAALTGFLGLGAGMIIVGQTLRLLSPLFLVLQGITFALSGGLALLVSPIGAAIAAIVALVLALESIGRSLYDLMGYKEVGSTFKTIGDAAGEAAANAARYTIASTQTIRDQWTETMAAVAQGLANGDVSGAMSAMLTQIEVSWLQTLDRMLTAWEDFQAATKIGSSVMIQENPTLMTALFGLPGRVLSTFFRTKPFRETIEGTRRDMTTDNPAREARRAAIEEKLLSLQQKQAQLQDTQQKDTEDYLDSYMGQTNSPQVAFEKMLESIKQGAGALIGPGAVRGGHIAPSTNDAAVRGTAEAFKDFQENKFNAFAKGLTDLLGAAEQTNRHLSSIDNKLGAEGV